MHNLAQTCSFPLKHIGACISWWSLTAPAKPCLAGVLHKASNIYSCINVSCATVVTQHDRVISTLQAWYFMISQSVESMFIKQAFCRLQHWKRHGKLLRSSRKKAHPDQSTLSLRSQVDGKPTTLLQNTSKSPFFEYNDATCMVRQHSLIKDKRACSSVAILIKLWQDLKKHIPALCRNDALRQGDSHDDKSQEERRSSLRDLFAKNEDSFENLDSVVSSAFS